MSHLSAALPRWCVPKLMLRRQMLAVPNVREQLSKSLRSRRQSTALGCARSSGRAVRGSQTFQSLLRKTALECLADRKAGCRGVQSGDGLDRTLTSVAVAYRADCKCAWPSRAPGLKAPFLVRAKVIGSNPIRHGCAENW